MTKHEALHKLLAIGGLTEREAVSICGWPREVFAATLADLLRIRDVTYENCGRGERVYRLA